MMILRLLPLALKQVGRHRTRSLLTVAGVGAAMFLFVAVQSLQAAVVRATRVTAADTALIVYRENRFCPSTSRLPERYEDRIARIAGVASVVPMKIVVNNCGASLDVIAYRGVPRESIGAMAAHWRVVGGSLEEWERRSDAAMLGSMLAARRGFKVGGSFDSAGVRVTVAGIVESSEPQDQNAAMVHLDFLQRAAGGGGPGVVTQFLVRVEDPALLEGVARAIDDEFRSDPEPTQTRPEKAFVALAGSDVVEIVGFTRWLGWGAIAAVLALVANAIVLSVQDRIKEVAIMQTLGFRPAWVSTLIVLEGLMLGLAGGLVGGLAAWAAAHFGKFSLSNEGFSVNVLADPRALLAGALVSAAVGVLAGIVPAARASRRAIATCFRAV